MWRVIGFSSDNSDPEFVIWHLLAERDDGRVQSGRIKVDRDSVAEHAFSFEGTVSKETQEVIRTQGRSLIEQTESRTLAHAYVLGVGGFIEEWD